MVLLNLENLLRLYLIYLSLQIERPIYKSVVIKDVRRIRYYLGLYYLISKNKLIYTKNIARKKALSHLKPFL